MDLYKEEKLKEATKLFRRKEGPELDKARLELEAAYSHLKEVENIFTEAKCNFEKAKEEWEERRRIYRKADYESALVDGRMNKVSEKSRVKKTFIPEDLTQEFSLQQLEEIAKKLGVSISVELR